VLSDDCRFKYLMHTLTDQHTHTHTSECVCSFVPSLDCSLRPLSGDCPKFKWRGDSSSLLNLQQGQVAGAAVRLTFLLNIRRRAAQFLIGFQAAFRGQQLIIFINMISTALEWTAILHSAFCNLNFHIKLVLMIRMRMMKMPVSIYVIVFSNEQPFICNYLF